MLRLKGRGSRAMKGRRANLSAVDTSAYLSPAVRPATDGRAFLYREAIITSPGEDARCNMARESTTNS